MAIAYFDCYSGVAGDMILGALVDVGMPLSYLKEQLSTVDIGSYQIRKTKGEDSFGGTNLNVVVKSGPEDAYPKLDRRISRSGLKKNVRDLAREMFARLARAEAKVHGVSINRVHFHEVGAVDSVVDVVGAAIGFEYFGFDSIYSTPLPITRGRVQTEHGMLPVPAPATLEILRGVPLEPSPVRDEIVTPTGAAILTTVAKSFCECPLQIVKKIGYGFGDKKIPGMQNALRLMIGEGFPVVVIQTNIDDMNPQIFDYVMERLFEAGAVDVDLAPCQMKKNRPAVKLSVLAPWERKDAVMDILFAETKTFGVRYWPVDRRVLSRELVRRKTKLGAMRFKIGCDGGGMAVRAVPEFEDVKKAARRLKRPLMDLYLEMMCEAGKLI